MAPMDRRVRLIGWALRKCISIPSLTDDDLAAIQKWCPDHNPVTDRIFGGFASGVESEDRTIIGPDEDIAVRVYRPEDACGITAPLILNFHGGGFVFGDLKVADWLCSSVVAAIGAIVVSVDYRLAPAHPFPAAVEDCYAALEWAAEHAEMLDATGPIGVMGDSAGGNLTAVTCLLARDRGGPAIGHQALLYPVTDMTITDRPVTSSVMMKTDAPLLSRSEMLFYRRHYLGQEDPADPCVSPLLAEDHSGLPPALIQVAEHDPLRDDGVRYADALRDAGVPVQLTEYAGMPHGYLNLPGVCRAAPDALTELCTEQQTALTHPATDFPA